MNRADITIHYVEQGSEEWAELRGGKNTSSGAAKIMGASPFMTRAAYLDERAGWIKRGPNKWTQGIYQAGHDFEDAARVFASDEMFSPVHPEVISATVDGVLLLGSFDGVAENGQIWECKTANKTLTENLLNGVLEAKYYWQLEHLMMAGGVSTVLFCASDGTLDGTQWLGYASKPDRRAQLLEEWRRFEIDLQSHELTAKVEPVAGRELVTLPDVSVSVDGAKISTNMAEIQTFLERLTSRELGKPAQTDQEAHDAGALAKTLAHFETSIKHALSQLDEAFPDIDKVRKSLTEAKATSRTLRIDRSKVFSAAKEERKRAILSEASDTVNLHVAALDARIGRGWGVALRSLSSMPDLKNAVSGLKTPASMENALHAVVSPWLTTSSAEIDVLLLKIALIANTGPENQELFRDWADICKNDVDAVKSIISSRVADKHAAMEKAKKEAAERAVKMEQARVEREKLEAAQEAAQIERDKRMRAVQAEDAKADILAGEEVMANTTEITKINEARQKKAAAEKMIRVRDARAEAVDSAEAKIALHYRKLQGLTEHFTAILPREDAAKFSVTSMVKSPIDEVIGMTSRYYDETMIQSAGSSILNTWISDSTVSVKRYQYACEGIRAILGDKLPLSGGWSGWALLRDGKLDMAHEEAMKYIEQPSGSEPVAHPRDGSFIVVLVPTKVKWEKYSDGYMAKRGRGGPVGRWVDEFGKKTSFNPDECEIVKGAV